MLTAHELLEAVVQKGGILAYRVRREGLEVLLAHPGGPDYEGLDKGYWTILKGGLHPGESAIIGAQREFTEETGMPPPPDLVFLGVSPQYPNCRVYTAHYDVPTHGMVSNTFFHPDGNVYHEMDDWRWFDLKTAREYMDPQFLPLLGMLRKHVKETT